MHKVDLNNANLQTVKIKGVLFDNDGTIADTRDMILECFRYATKTVLGVAYDDNLILSKVGIPLVDQMKDFSDDKNVQAQLVDAYRKYTDEIHDKTIKIFDGEKKSLKLLQNAGVSMGVVTSKRHELTLRGLQILGIDDCFEVLIGCDDTTKHKPNPEPVLAGVKALGLTPEDCAYVGDSPFDMKAANAAGCVSVAVTWGMFDEQTLAAENPNYICTNFDELANLLLSLCQ